MNCKGRGYSSIYDIVIYMTIYKFFDVQMIDDTHATIKFNNRGIVFFDAEHMILNSIRQLWNITVNVPQIDKMDIVIHENTSPIYDPIIKFQITQLPQSLDQYEKTHVIDYEGPGWLNIRGFNIARLGVNERIKMEYTVSKWTTVIGPCPYIDEMDVLHVETYYIGVLDVIKNIVERIEIFIEKWVKGRILEYGVCEDDKSCQLALVNALIFFMNNGHDVIMGHKTGHMFLDPIEIVVERGVDENVTNRWMSVDG